MHIDVGVCTFRRTSLYATLDSIARQSIPPETTFRVIVADNDETAALRARIEDHAKAIGLPLIYVHAPSRNISIARNACLDAARGDALMFIDDDEIADPRWMANLMSCWHDSGAKVVFGPAIALYPPEAPDWMRRNDFHSNRPAANGGIVETGFSSNVLLDLSDPVVAGCRFDPAFGRTGGEDVDFFFRLHRAGVPMAISPDATVTEPVSPTRLSFGWVLRRRRAQGAIYGSCVAPEKTGLRTRVFFTSLAKMLYCAIWVVPTVVRPKDFHFWIMRAAFHFGVVSGCIAPPRREVYGGVH